MVTQNWITFQLANVTLSKLQDAFAFTQRTLEKNRITREIPYDQWKCMEFMELD